MAAYLSHRTPHTTHPTIPLTIYALAHSGQAISPPQLPPRRCFRRRSRALDLGRERGPSRSNYPPSPPPNIININPRRSRIASRSSRLFPGPRPLVLASPRPLGSLAICFPSRRSHTPAIRPPASSVAIMDVLPSAAARPVTRVRRTLG